MIVAFVSQHLRLSSSKRKTWENRNWRSSQKKNTCSLVYQSDRCPRTVWLHLTSDCKLFRCSGCLPRLKSRHEAGTSTMHTAGFGVTFNWTLICLLIKTEVVLVWWAQVTFQRGVAEGQNIKTRTAASYHAQKWYYRSVVLKLEGRISVVDWWKSTLLTTQWNHKNYKTLCSIKTYFNIQKKVFWLLWLMQTFVHFL